MKTIKWIVLALVATFSLCGCDSRVLDFRNAEIVNGKVYGKGANKPFSGKVTNVPDRIVLTKQNGYASFMEPLHRLILNVAEQGGASRHPLLSTAICDLGVKDGVLQGEVTCQQPQSRTLRYKMGFRDGVLDGPFNFYDWTEENAVLSSAEFKEGQLHGRQEVFSPKTQKLLWRFHRDHGVFSGEEKGFDENTGELVSRLTYNKGVVEGAILKYAPDGKRLIYKATAVGGLKHGSEQQFDVVSGNPLLRAEWASGKKNGSFKQWDVGGNLVADAVFREDQLISDALASQGNSSGQSVESCVAGWMESFRKGKGEDTMINADQLIEWETWCETGKKAV